MKSMRLDGLGRRLFLVMGLCLVMFASACTTVPVEQVTPPLPAKVNSDPSGMVLIPSGEFSMGDPYKEGNNDEIPVHKVYVIAFYLDKYLVTGKLWKEVYVWAKTKGYQFDYPGASMAAGHPVQSVTWYDVVKWLNARSEKEGRTPVYYTDAGQTSVYRSGLVPLSHGMVRWGANGYRLPTEAEWEKAARGGLDGHHYPWPSLENKFSDHIDGSKANYADSEHHYRKGNGPATTPVGYYNGHQSPAGADMANGYGLYDMSGNLNQWVWDWYDSAWYGKAAALQRDGRGPDLGFYRIVRGGSWNNGPGHLRCATRSFYGPADWVNGIGFRAACSQP
ncbi:MAG: formylglycine-generating enzyme family protein [Deltaproteobacteria bacterium]|nr:formylglycine-generating enzyme family protein [Deltaproteobacteria bacterium]